MTTIAAGQVLRGPDLPALFDLLNRDSISNVFVASRVESAGLDLVRLGGEVWPYYVGGELKAACYAGANLVPIGADETACEVFAQRARRQGRRCSSIVGPADMVAAMWRTLSSSWGPARDVRSCQPLLSIDRPPAAVPDPAVRRVSLAEFDQLLPASIAMFTEEVGISPVASDGGVTYRGRVRELVERGRAFARIEDGRVVFKAEVGAVSRSACQVQGVWVDPSLRGNGISVAGMAAVVEAARRDFAPVVSLYVNDFNAPARRAYERVGFRQVGTFASVLF